MLGIEALPALLYMLLTLSIPNTPRMANHFQNNDSAAAKTLKEIYRDDQEAESVFNQIKSADNDAADQEKLINNVNRKIVTLAFLISFFNQLSGINFILYYAPEILEMAGFATRASLFNSVLIGLTNIVFTFAGLILIDKLGRRQLLILGSLGYILSLSGVSIAFYFQTSPQWIALFIFAFVPPMPWVKER